MNAGSIFERSRTYALVGLFSLATACSTSPAAPSPPAAGAFPAPVPAPSAAPPTLQVTKFMAFGDSLTEGEWWPGFQIYEPAKAYPIWLLQLLQARYPAQTFDIDNKGIGGKYAVCDAEPVCTDPAGNPITDRFVPALSTHPQVVLLLQGVNDLHDGTSIGDIVDALRIDIKNARLAGAYVFISTLTITRQATAGYVPPAGVDYSPKSWFVDNPQLLVTTNAAIKAMVAGEQGATLVDGYAITQANPNLYVGADGVHLSIEGYQALAKGFFDAIKAKYEVPAPVPQWAKGPSISSISPHVEVRP